MKASLKVQNNHDDNKEEWAKMTKDKRLNLADEL